MRELRVLICLGRRACGGMGGGGVGIPDCMGNGQVITPGWALWLWMPAKMTVCTANFRDGETLQAHVIHRHGREPGDGSGFARACCLLRKERARTGAGRQVSGRRPRAATRAAGGPLNLPLTDERGIRRGSAAGVHKYSHTPAVHDTIHTGRGQIRTCPHQEDLIPRRAPAPEQARQVCPRPFAAQPALPSGLTRPHRHENGARPGGCSTLDFDREACKELCALVQRLHKCHHPRLH